MIPQSIALTITPRGHPQSFMEENLCCIVGSWWYYSFLVLKTAIRYSMLTYTLNGCNVGMKIFWESTLDSSIEETLCFTSWLCKATFGLNHKGKNIEFRLLCFTPSNHIHQTLHQVISIFFALCKMLRITKKISQEDQAKTIVENLSWILLERN